jgi:polyribonucleotide nucleotidyltransferase
MEAKSFEMDLAGRKLVIETGKVAKQTNGAVTARYGDTEVLATVVMSDGTRPGTDFFPLMVEYDEKLYASGKIKGSRFVKREGRASDEAQLTARLIDRPLRPLFDQRIRKDIQVVITTLSYDGVNDPDIPALIASATAILISDLPFEAPLAGVRVGIVDGKMFINPTEEQMDTAELDLVVAGTSENIMMVEAGAKQVPEAEILKAMEFGHEAIREITAFQEKIMKAVGKPKITLEFPESGDAELKSRIEKIVGGRLDEILSINQKIERNEKTAELEAEVVEKITADFDDTVADNKLSTLSAKQAELRLLTDQVKEIFHEVISDRVRLDIISKEERIGGRQLDEIRPISIEVGLFPRTHGAGLFTRGETQVLTVATLGSPGDEQIIDGMEEEYKKRFIHHYNMPAFATGETKPSRWPSRRELGHGAMAERALEPMLPPKDKFPYTIRLVSEVLEANGSTSMASTCASSLALMDAGVPITAPVAGVAMGLVTDGKGNYKVLTDIQGEEDHLGDMDFKVTGTTKGVTCMQMDIKIKGIPREIFEQAIMQAQKGRLEILEKMVKVIPTPRADLSKYAPRIKTLHIKPDQIGDVIGPGGKIINAIIDETGVKIDIEDDGSVMISSTDPDGMAKAIKRVEDLTKEAVVGELYHGKVTRLMDFGAFVEIFPGTEGLIHISQLAPYRVNRVEDIVKVGDEVDVVVSEIDEQNRVNLSKKMADEKLGKKPLTPPPGYESKPAAPRGFRNNRGRSDFHSRPPHKRKPFFRKSS